MKRFDEYFAPLLGNEGLKSRLKAEFERDALPHACLITGDDGCGRNLAATLLAAAYLQDAHDLVRRAEHPDCLELRGEGASGQISVNRVRETLYELSKSAVTAQDRRVALFRDAASLNRNSANALLKGLEAPPHGAIFIITAQSERDVLETIRSRCVRFGVLPLDEEACRAALRTLYPTYDRQRLDTLCRLYGGRLGLIKRALSNADRLALCDTAQRIYAAAKKEDRLGILAAMDVVADRASLQAILFDLTMCARADVAENPQLAAFADKLTRAAAECASDADKNINVKLLCTRFAAQRDGEF